MRLSLRSLAGPLTGALVLMSAPAFANVVFSDGTFKLANYTTSPIFTSAGVTLRF